MTQRERDKAAVRRVLAQLGHATYADIALRGGEGLASALSNLVSGKEVVEAIGERTTYYRLAQQS